MKEHSVGVIIPARNEALLLRESLGSVLRAIAHSQTECFVVLVDDGSTDETAEIAYDMLAPGLGCVLSINRGNVGAARAAGVDYILGSRVRTSTWIACTDADTIVPQDWIAGQLGHASAGADGVAGLVDLDCRGGNRLRGAFADAYGTQVSRSAHPHIHGANLGVSAASYVAVGGFAPIPRGEDQDLWSRLAASGHRLVSDTRSVVTTSSRLVSRTSGGFASYLRQLSATMPSGDEDLPRTHSVG